MSSNLLAAEYLFDSRRRTSGTSSSPTYTLSAPTNITSVQVLGLEIPVSWYAINTGNNKLDFHDGSIRTATLTPGNYTRSTLPAMIKDAMEAVSARTFTVTISPDTLHLTIEADGAFSLRFGTGPNAPTGTGLGIDRILGYSRTDTGSALTHTGTYAINLVGESYVFVTSPVVNGTSIIVPVGNTDIENALTRIQITVPPNGYVMLTEPGKEIYVGKENVTDIAFGLRFQDNMDIDLNGQDWSILLRINTFGNV